MTSATASLFLFDPVAAQFLPPAKRAAHVQITHGPELERADADFAIIRWTSNNPGGSDKHYGVVHYGASSKNLSESAKSPIRLNRGHTETIFRVRVEGLKPATTYYYTVDSQEADGESDKVQCAVQHFTTPSAGR
jgi:phosphodiesterase/alkaline phosphatase D-like protein